MRKMFHALMSFFNPAANDMAWPGNSRLGIGGAGDARLRWSFDTIDQIVLNSKEWLWETDARARIIACGQAVEPLLGKTPDYFIGKALADIVLPQDKDRVAQALVPIFLKKEAFSGLVFTVAGKADEIIWIEASGVPVVDGGVFVGFRGLSRDITAQEKSRGELRLEKEQLNLLMKTVPSAVFTVDLERRITSWNKRAAEITGYPEEEALGQACGFFAVEPCQRVCGLYSEAVEKPICGRESVIRTKSGDLRTVLKNADLLRDLAGNIVGGVESFDDITERHKGENKLLEVNKVLFEQHKLFIQGDIAVFKWKNQPGWAVEYISPNCKAILGYSRDEFLQGNVVHAEVIHPEDRAGFKKAIEEMLLTKRINFTRFEGRFIRKDLREMWVLHYFTVIVDDHGKITHILGYLMDVTDRKVAEQELSGYRQHLEELIFGRTKELGESNEKLKFEIAQHKESKRVLDSRLRYEKGMALFTKELLGGEGDLSRALSFLLEASGASRVYMSENVEDPVDGLCMRQTHEACAPDVASQAGHPLRRHWPYKNGFERFRTVLSADKVIEGLVEGFPPEERDVLGAQAILSLLILPIFVDGQWFGFIGFDETKDRRRWSFSEIRLLQTSAEILSIYFERARAMNSLKEAKEKAEEGSRLKSQFIFNVSHEIRTPLNCIIGYTEIIANTREIAQIHDMAQTVLKESEVLLALLNDVLDQAKIEAGKLEFESAAVDLAELIGVVHKTLTLVAQKKGLDATVDISGALPQYVWTDRLRVFQCLMNFVNNAAKFTQKGSITIKAALVEEKDGVAFVRFAVKDTGLGIPKDKQHLIFERFAQVDGGRTRRYGGTGLGTSIVKGLVELMGGQLGFDSVPGEGSEFWFVLPLKVCTAGEAAKKTLATGEVGDFTNVHRSRILVVDDYLPNQDVARMHLEGAGYEVGLASDGVAAIRACEDKAFDLILMDIQMPEMDGFQAARELRRRDGWTKEVVILGLTANADEQTIKDCRAAGMNGVLTKPIRREAFLAQISRWARVGTNQEPVLVPTEIKQAGPLDYHEAIREFGGNQILLDGIVQKFMLQVRQQQMPAMAAALAAKDITALGKEAHKVRGGAANLTATPLAKSAAAIEEQCKSGQEAGLAELLAVFKNEFEKLDVFIRNGYK
ncbi:MAG: PAS domain S-box protein [Candidatus Omnitrophica bacterium]|nr:PAS domain S-box protein [Candidatus Omnitrophota bacterium]